MDKMDKKEDALSAQPAECEHYRIVQESNLGRLSRAVDKFVGDGFCPVGGIYQDRQYDSFHKIEYIAYCQAIYRVGSPPKPPSWYKGCIGKIG